MSLKKQADSIIAQNSRVRKKLPYTFSQDEIVLYKEGIVYHLLKVYGIIGTNARAIKINGNQKDEVYHIIDGRIDGTPVAPFFLQLADEIYITNQVGGHRYVVGNIDYEPNAGYFAELGYVEHHEIKKVKLLLVDIIEHIKF